MMLMFEKLFLQTPPMNPPTLLTAVMAPWFMHLLIVTFVFLLFRMHPTNPPTSNPVVEIVQS